MKVISFCLWGDKPQYKIGAIKNIKLAKEIYPDWRCWFFMNEDEYWRYDDAFKNTIFELGGSFQIFPHYKQHHLMLARFLAINIKPSKWADVEVMLSRDCDSRLSLREKLAVDEWIASDKGFHTMHDHFHHSVPILGGMFGIKSDVISDMSILIDNWLKIPRRDNGQYWQIDQEFLTNIIWPKVQNNIMNHADFHTNIWPGIPFKSKRNGREFVGATYDENDMVDVDQMRQLWG